VCVCLRFAHVFVWSAS